MGHKVEEILNAAKLNDLLHRKRIDDEKKHNLVWILAIIGAVATIAIIAFAVYRYFAPNYLDDWDDDFEDDFDDFEDFDDDGESPILVTDE